MALQVPDNTAVVAARHVETTHEAMLDAEAYFDSCNISLETAREDVLRTRSEYRAVMRLVSDLRLTDA